MGTEKLIKGEVEAARVKTRGIQVDTGGYTKISDDVML